MEREKRKSIGDTTPLYLHSDASQGLGLIDVHVSRLGVDMITLNAAKVYGPKQVGLLWASRSVRLTAQIAGGGQERGGDEIITEVAAIQAVLLVDGPVFAGDVLVFSLEDGDGE